MAIKVLSSKKSEDFPDVHPTQESRNFFPTDQLLRRNGYAIHERRRGREPLWKLGDKVYPQEEALANSETSTKQ